MSATIGLDGWTRLVDREVNESRRAGQRRTPVIKLRSEHFALQPPTLPVCEICILNLQLCERRFFTTRISSIERRHFAHEDADGPTIANDVMHRYQHHVLLCAEPQQTHTQ